MGLSGNGNDANLALRVVGSSPGGNAVFPSFFPASVTLFFFYFPSVIHSGCNIKFSSFSSVFTSSFFLLLFLLCTG